MTENLGSCALGAVVLIALFGCGSRDALESGEVPGAGGFSTGGVSFGSGGTFPGTGGGAESGGSIGFGGFGTAGGGPVQIGRRCISCVTEQCPQATQCLLDPACRNGTFCLATTCIGAGGTPDLQCVNKCFNGDAVSAARALEALGCLVTNCVTSCQP